MLCKSDKPSIIIIIIVHCSLPYEGWYGQLLPARLARRVCVHVVVHLVQVHDAVAVIDEGD